MAYVLENCCVITAVGLPKFTSKLSEAGPSEAGGLGGLQPPNNLLKFVNFVSEKGCKSQGRRNEDANSYVFVEATRIHLKCDVF